MKALQDVEFFANEGCFKVPLKLIAKVALSLNQKYGDPLEPILSQSVGKKE